MAEFKESYPFSEIKDIYWKSCSRDGYLNIYIYRRLSMIFAVIAAKLKWTPNRLTVISGLLSLASAAMFAPANFTLALWGLIPFHLGKILDCSDGQLASLTKQRSALGAFLDPFFDRIVDIAILSALAVAYLFTNHSSLGLYLVIGLVTIWFLGAYLDNYSEKKVAETVNDMRASIKVPGFVMKLLKWDGGFSGLIYTIAIVFGNEWLLLPVVLSICKDILPIPGQFVGVYRRLRSES